MIQTRGPRCVRLFDLAPSCVSAARASRSPPEHKTETINSHRAKMNIDKVVVVPTAEPRGAASAAGSSVGRRSRSVSGIYTSGNTGTNPADRRRNNNEHVSKKKYYNSPNRTRYQQNRPYCPLIGNPNYHMGYHPGSETQRSFYNIAAYSLRDVCLFSGEAHADNSRGYSRNRNDEDGSHKERELKDAINDSRPWYTTHYGAKIRNTSTNGTKFVILSYNVLAQDLLTQHAFLYRSHTPKALLWDIRWKNLYKEISSYKADIMCLQEVQESHIKDYYNDFLKLGYASLFKRRTGNYTDGCAFFYKTSKFKLLEHTTVEMKQDFHPLDRHNVAIIAKLAPRNNLEATFVVATTHLLFNPRRQDVRVAQTQVLLAEIDRFAYIKNKSKYQYVPIILTGDFNSEPYSAVYKLVVNGKLKYMNLMNKTLFETNSTSNLTGKVLNSPELRITDGCQHFDLLKIRDDETLSRSDEEGIIQIKHSGRNTPAVSSKRNSSLFSTGTLSHKLNLFSAFEHQRANDTEGTTYQDGWITVDYIFYSGTSCASKTQDDRLKLVSQLMIPTKSQFKKFKHIPNSVLGSDHISLLCKFHLNF